MIKEFIVSKIKINNGNIAGYYKNSINCKRFNYIILMMR